jgi:tetratricopeptide (TPR) repeat protein
VNALERGDSRMAEGILAQAVDQCPGDPEARRHHAEALWNVGEQTKAIAELDEALRLAPDDDEMRVAAARMRLAVGDLSGARRQADDAVRLNPNSASAWAARGRVQLRNRQPREALADLHRSLGRAPDDREALLDLAECYRQLNQPQRALLALQHVGDTYAPGDEPQQVLWQQALALGALGRHSDAARTLIAARDRGPASSTLLEHLAAAQQASGQLNEATQTLAQAQQLNPAVALSAPAAPAAPNAPVARAQVADGTVNR